MIITKWLLAFTLSSLSVSAQDGEGGGEQKQAANDALPNASKDLQKKAWLTSVDRGVEQAKRQKKFVLIEFTGSDWCPPCMMMAKKVFGKKAFLDGVKKDFVIVKLDMPNSDEKLKKANTKLMQKYKVTGVPTILLLDAEGKEFSRFVASQFRTVESFLKKLEVSVRRKDMF